MKTACPNCGAEVEFRYDDSFVRICGHCRNAVQRSDRGIETLGKVADLVPIDSPLKLFSDGQLGSQSFILVGMAQLRHEAGGMTQEWYARFGGSWGWLAEAQGRYYMTFEVEGAQIPPLSTLAAGSQVQLPTMLGAMRTFTVAEVGRSTYVSVNGEIPFRLVPDSSYRFADLSDGEGNFATIDYGDSDSDTPQLYVGQQLSLADLHISGGESEAPRATTIKSTRLGCPNCNAPVDLYVPDQSQRAVCKYCNHILDVKPGGSLAVIEKLRVKAQPRIPLGSTGKFQEGPMRVIGFIGRSAQVEGDWYPFEEYLLYAPEVGFRWLVNSDGHWSYVQPIAVGAVTSLGTEVSYEEVKFRLFQNAPLRVDQVLGEVYWQVRVGEQVYADDYVAPPAMISRETSGNEENWSLSTYMKISQVEDAFEGTQLGLGSPTGVAPNQPDPVGAVATPITLAFVALIVLGIAFAMIAPNKTVLNSSFSIPAGVQMTTSDTGELVPSNIWFSEPFRIDKGHNVQVAFSSSLDNNWAYVIASLVNTGNGEVFTIDASMEYYSGVEDGESWSEGDQSAKEFIGPPGAGEYVLRVEGQQGGNLMNVPVTVTVKQGVFRMMTLGIALIVLGVPFLILGLYTWSFERRRWTNSTQGTSGAPKNAMTIAVAAIAGLLMGIVLILKAFAESGSDDD